MTENQHLLPYLFTAITATTENKIVQNSTSWFSVHHGIHSIWTIGNCVINVFYAGFLTLHFLRWKCALQGSFSNFRGRSIWALQIKTKSLEVFFLRITFIK